MLAEVRIIVANDKDAAYLQAVAVRTSSAKLRRYKRRHKAGHRAAAVGVEDVKRA